MIKVGLIGTGYWGPNFARIANQSKTSELVFCSDLNKEKLDSLKTQYPYITVTNDYQRALGDVDAVIVATPAETHYKIAKDCLEHGKHVLVEKPMAFTSKECEELVAIAEKKGVALMVGHTYEYNSCVNELKKYVDTKEIGVPYYIYSTRVNLGRIREDVNAMWNLAPHDISVLNYVLGSNPVKVTAHGKCFIQKDIEDVVFMILEYPNNVIAQVHVSWLDPGKVRKMTMVGSDKMIIFDDMDNEAKIKVYDKSAKKERLDDEKFGLYQIKLRAGDIVMPKIDLKEPLKEEYEHFIDCIKNGKEPISSGKVGLEVVKVLEAAQRSLKNNSESVKL